MIELKNICKEYETTNNALKVKALKNINLTLDRGLVTIVGKSGSGKTSLLNLIGGIDKITKGNIYYNGIDVNTFRSVDYDLYRQNVISYVFQDFNLLSDYSVIENIKLACRLQGNDRDKIDAKANEALNAVDLLSCANRNINTLSGGQQQRVAIARAIAKDSQIILCDEPTGNLDSQNATEIFELLKEIAKQRLVIVVTHDIEYAHDYADRIIRLHDGCVIEDINNSSIVTEIIDENKNKVIQSHHKHCGLSGKDTIWLIGKNFKSSLFGNLIVMVILIAAIALSTIFVSLYQYNSQDAYVNTLKSNQEHIIQITKYKDYPREVTDENNNSIIMHGPELWYDNTQIEDLHNLKVLTENKAHFYTSYFFNKNFQDFSNRSIYTDLTHFQYAANSFRTIIAVEDFSTFYLPLQYGHKPNEANEALIYDYMAYCLIYHEVFDCDIANLVGKVLTDKQTGTSMRISGIIKSSYEQYSYIKNDNNKHEFEETYLTSLQSIYCKSEFIELIQQKEKNYNSIYNCYLSNDSGSIYDTNIKKLKVTDIKEHNYIATSDNYETERGVIVDKKMVAKALNVGMNEVTESKAREFMQNIYVNGLKSYYDYSVERNLLTTYAYQIIAVADDLEENVLYFYTPNAIDLQMFNMSLRQFYLSLGDNWTLNKNILNKFVYQIHSEDFYLANPDYTYEGYTDYTSYGILIRDADYYLVMVKEFAQNIMIVLICVSAIGMYLYAVLQINRNKYKVGVLKSMGASNLSIMLLFGLQILFVAVIAYLISLPVSIGMMSGINATFVHGINPNLVFFSITPLSIILMLIFSFVTILISVSIPLINLYRQSPLTIIRKNK